MSATPSAISNTATVKGPNHTETSPSRRVRMVAGTLAAAAIISLGAGRSAHATERASDPTPLLGQLTYSKSATMTTAQFTFATQVMFNGARMTLDNHAPGAGAAWNSPFVPDGLRFGFYNQPTREWYLPQSVDVPTGLTSFIDGVKLTGADATWQGDGVDLTLKLSEGAHDAFPAYSLMPPVLIHAPDYDVALSNITVKVHVVPVVDGVGQLTFKVVGSPNFSGLRNTCVYFPQNGGPNICNVLDRIFGTLKPVIEERIKTVMTDATTRQQAAPYYDSFVPSAAVGKFVAVSVSGGTIKLLW